MERTKRASPDRAPSVIRKYERMRSMRGSGVLDECYT
jgi:hypothetical protein